MIVLGMSQSSRTSVTAKGLYDLKAHDKACSQLSTMVIKYMQKMFAYALQDCAGKPDDLKRTLKAIVPHAFGEHTLCDAKWCGYLRNRETYKHSGLPRGKDLSCAHTNEVLCNIFHALSEQSEKLAPLGSSQANESFNNIVCSKAPKSRHYGGSESNDIRVATAVLQKNNGRTYVQQILEEAGMSPGLHTENRARQMERSSALRRARAQSRGFKRRRLELRNKRSDAQDTTELREGSTYSSGCMLLGGDLDIEIIRH